MDYKELIEQLMDESAFQRGRFSRFVLADELEGAATAIETLLETARWVSVKEKLPEPDVDILMFFKKSGNMAVGSMVYPDDTEHWTCNIGDGLYKYCEGVPDFWMPLPNKPNKSFS